MRCVFVVPKLKRLSSRVAFSAQTPLGHILVGSALLLDGHEVHLIDADWEGLSLRQTVNRLLELKPDCVLIGHSGSTIAHPNAVVLARAAKAAIPKARVIYGGIFPTYNALRAFVESDWSVDFVIAHEGEKATVELLRDLENGGNGIGIRGVISREAVNKGLPARALPNLVIDLDAYRPLWEQLWQKWRLCRYRAYGLPAAVVQFSRGCPKTCSYCGQWDFWKSWRHRSIDSFVAEVDWLSRHGVRVFWVADENWGLDQEMFLTLLMELRKINRGHHFLLTMECSHVIRDMTHHRLYAEAGLSQIMLGIDGEDENLLGRSPKRYSFQKLAKAIENLQSFGVTVIANFFIPMDGTSRPATPQELRSLNSDFYNCLHPTPHNWTPFGERAASYIVNADLTQWDYRHPVLGKSKGELLRKAWQGRRMEIVTHGWALMRWLLGMRKQKNALIARAYLLSVAVFLWETSELILATSHYLLGKAREWLLDKLRHIRSFRKRSFSQAKASAVRRVQV